MRLEQIPLFFGVVVAIIGLGLLLDAQLPEGSSQARERRRRQRAERNRVGQTLVGAGIMAVAASLIGRDSWRFGTVAVLVGVVLLAAGGWLNRAYLREIFLFRGPARRGEKRTTPRADASPSVSGPRQAVRVVPGLADSPPRREPGALRGDREAPIMTGADGIVKRGNSLGDDTPPDAHARLRIR